MRVFPGTKTNWDTAFDIPCVRMLSFLAGTKKLERKLFSSVAWERQLHKQMEIPQPLITTPQVFLYLKSPFVKQTTVWNLVCKARCYRELLLTTDVNCKRKRKSPFELPRKLKWPSHLWSTLHPEFRREREKFDKVRRRVTREQLFCFWHPVETNQVL